MTATTSHALELEHRRACRSPDGSRVVIRIGTRGDPVARCADCRAWRVVENTPALPHKPDSPRRYWLPCSSCGADSHPPNGRPRVGWLCDACKELRRRQSVDQTD